MRDGEGCTTKIYETRGRMKGGFMKNDSRWINIDMLMRFIR